MPLLHLNRRSLVVCAVAIATLILASVSSTNAQIPDEFTNLKVLHKDISKRELMDYMKAFARALEVRCEYCHVAQPGQSFSEMDFAADDKEQKRTARLMLAMVENINTQQLAKLESSSDHKAIVTCMTCHRGHQKPETIYQALSAAYADGGVDSVISTYKDLREEYYGGAGYDFREEALSGYAAELTEMQKYDDALRVLELNTEFYPKSASIETFMAMTCVASGQQDAAIAHLKKALEFDPENRRAERMLQRLQKQ